MHFNTNERLQQALWHNCVSSSIVISISSHGDLETLPQQAPRITHGLRQQSSTSSEPCQSNFLRNRVASSFKSSTSSAGDLETLAQQALQCNCVVVAYIGNKDLETLTQQALQHDLMASFFTQSTVAKHSSQQSTVHQAEQPDALLAPPSKSWGCRKAARRCISILMRGCNEPSGISTFGDLEPLPQQALPRNGVASSIKSSSSSCGDLQTLAQQGLQCNCVVPAYIGNKDLETLTLQALQHNLMASSLTHRTTQSTMAQQSSQEATVLQARRPEADSTSSVGDLETLAQQALQCNCVVAAYISNKDLETLILQALQHDLMASSFTQNTTQSTLAQQSSQEATVLKLGSPKLCWPGQQVAGAAARLPGDAFQY
ncbi:hypothetical protein AAY473_037237 [Plecturocebus cupreus]